MTEEIISNVNNHLDYIRYLKNKAPIYPNIYTEGKGSIDDRIEIFFTTLVNFEFENNLYQRHHVRSYIFDVYNDNNNINHVLNRLKEDCLSTISYGVPIIHDTIIKQ